MGKERFFSTNGAEITGSHMQKSEVGPFLRLYTKINSKCITVLDLKVKIIKFLEKNMGVNLHDLRLGKAFLVLTPKADMTKKKWINKPSSELTTSFFEGYHQGAEKMAHRMGEKYLQGVCI